jgi:hypothetical protein
VRREKISRILKEAREQYFKRLESQGGAVKTIAKKEDNLLFVIDKDRSMRVHILFCHPGHTDTAISEEVSASRCLKIDHCYSFLKDAIDS